MTLSGVPLAARFSLPTNRLRYCGPSDAEGALARPILRGDGLEAAARALEGFEALMPYLRAIARRHDKAPFDTDVVEAYWIGNDLVEGFGPTYFREILKDLAASGLPRGFADRLADRLPSGALPHHAFHVTFVGVGAVTGKVSTTLANMDRCRPSWGRVVRLDPSEMTVERRPLEAVDGRLRLGRPKEAWAAYDARFLPDLRPGDTVALHWGWPAAVLEPAQVRRLETYTGRTLEATNEALEALPVG